MCPSSASQGPPNQVDVELSSVRVDSSFTSQDLLRYLYKRVSLHRLMHFLEKNIQFKGCNHIEAY